MLFFRYAGELLVVDDRQRSDAIVTLPGDDAGKRYLYALALLRQGYARDIVVDVRRDVVAYGRTREQYAAAFVARTAGESAAHVHVCGTSETASVPAPTLDDCLRSVSAHSVLLVTNDYHSRLALATVRHLLPNYTWTVAATHDPGIFGERWWTRREWAKTTLQEWEGLLYAEISRRWEW